MTERFLERTRDRLRRELLDAAIAEVRACGWRGLRMQAVADAVGVSRQTVYNEFVNKRGLAKVLALNVASPYRRQTALTIERSPDVRTAIHDTVKWTMETSANDMLLKTLLGADGGETFLPLYTSEGSPVIDSAVAEIGGALSRRFPELDPERLALVMDAATRYVLSHVVLPTRSADKVAEDAAVLFGDFLTAPGRLG